MPRNVDLARWLEVWLDDCARRTATDTLAPRTLDAYRRALRLWIVPHIGDVKLAQLEPRYVLLLHEKVLATPTAGGKRRGPATAAQAHRTLGTALQAALAAGLINRNPVRLVKTPSTANLELAGAYTPDQVTALTAAAANPQQPLAMSPARVVCSCVLGLRQAEILGLQLAAVHLAGAQLHVDSFARKVWKHGPTCPDPDNHTRAKCPTRRQVGMDTKRTKTRAGWRTVPIPSWCLPILETQIAAVTARAAKLGTPPTFLFPAELGGHTSHRIDNARWARLVAATLGPDAPSGTHAGRRTAATRFAEAGVPVQVAMTVFGWPSGELLSIYSRVGTTATRTAMDAACC